MNWRAAMEALHLIKLRSPRLLLVACLGLFALLALALNVIAATPGSPPSQGPEPPYTSAFPSAAPTPSPTMTPGISGRAAPAPEAAGCADRWEPDNDTLHAHSFLMDGHSEAHTLHATNDADYLAITAAAGATYTLTTSNLISTTDTIIHVYRADGVTLAAVGDDIHWPDNIASRATWQATYTGVYFARVRDFYWHGDCGMGYTVTGQASDQVFHAFVPFMLQPVPTDTPTITPTPTETDTPTITLTPSIAPTPTETLTPSPTLTPSTTPTRGPVVLPTAIAIPEMRYPNGLAADASTNRVYITSRDNGRVIALDGINLWPHKVADVAPSPWGVAANPTTHKVYVAGFGDSSVSILDGDTLARLGRISLGSDAQAELTYVAIDAARNRAFVASHGYNQIVVIDGSTDTVQKRVSTNGLGTFGLAYNPNLNRVYASLRDSNTIVTLDGNNGFARLDNQTAAAACGSLGSPFAMDFNPDNNKLYVACASLAEVDTAAVYQTSSTGIALIAWLPIDRGGKDGGGGVAVDRATGNVYFTNAATNTVSVVGGSTDTLLRNGVPAGANPFGIAIDPSTRRVFIGARDGNEIRVLADN